MSTWRATAAWCALGLWVAGLAFGNGGPFVIKYPEGDPAAKGVLARLDPSLKPSRETRLRVVKEDLTIDFGADPESGSLRANVKVVGAPPLARVAAAYTIENPTDEAVEVDFGFPILRGIYISPWGMAPVADATVTVNNNTHVKPMIISTSAIYGIIRAQALDAIEKAIAADETFGKLVGAVRQAQGEAREAARKALAEHLTGSMKWNERDAALLVEYAGLTLGPKRSQPLDASYLSFWTASGPDREALQKLITENLGPLSAIGEQKATQFLAQLASRFDPKAAAGYEAIFTAWGGDVRERSIDLATGQVRPREVVLDPEAMKSPRLRIADPTIYARVDYLDPNAKISDEEKASCQAILKSLPVVFTFAPMNLLHYRVSFPARSTQILTVAYRQYAFLDTKAPRSYQLAYVVHPASLWKDFGPIHVAVSLPGGVALGASVPFEHRGTAHRATLTEKTGELLLAVAADAWDKADKTPPNPQPAQPQQMMR